MAIVSNPLIGKSKQSAGGITFTAWKGRNVLKNKATSVANPRTPAQVSNRNLLSGVSKFYAKHKVQLSLPMLRMMGDVTDGNVFASLNRLCFLTSSVGLDLTKVDELILSKGSLGTFPTYQIAEGSGGQTDFDFTYEANPAQSSPTDRIAMVLLNSNTDVMAIGSIVASPAPPTSNVSVPYSQGDTIHGWIYSYSESGKKLSDSVYVGSYVIA